MMVGHLCTQEQNRVLHQWVLSIVGGNILNEMGFAYFPILTLVFTVFQVFSFKLVLVF